MYTKKTKLNITKLSVTWSAKYQEWIERRYKLFVKIKCSNDTGSQGKLENWPPRVKDLVYAGPKSCKILNSLYGAMGGGGGSWTWTQLLMLSPKLLKSQIPCTMGMGGVQTELPTFDAGGGGGGAGGSRSNSQFLMLILNLLRSNMVGGGGGSRSNFQLLMLNPNLLNPQFPIHCGGGGCLDLSPIFQDLTSNQIFPFTKGSGVPVKLKSKLPKPVFKLNFLIYREVEVEGSLWTRVQLPTFGLRSFKNLGVNYKKLTRKFSSQSA